MSGVSLYFGQEEDPLSYFAVWWEFCFVVHMHAMMRSITSPPPLD
jgi:hypothetical protein